MTSRRARALPTRVVWVSYAVAVLCLSGFWSGGMASVAFAPWLIGAVIGVLLRRGGHRRNRPVPAQGAPAREAARTPPTTTSG
jgi:fatty acid desaturase